MRPSLSQSQLIDELWRSRRRGWLQSIVSFIASGKVLRGWVGRTPRKIIIIWIAKFNQKRDISLLSHIRNGPICNRKL